MIAIVIIGLFTRQVPALAAKVVIVFHIIAYGTFQFVLKDLVPVHFLHLYAILFVVEVTIMLAIGFWRPRREEAAMRQDAEVDLTPWAYAQPCAVTLLSCVVALYVVFSPIGLVGDGPNLFAPFCWDCWGLTGRFGSVGTADGDRRFGVSRMTKPSSPLEGNTAERVAALTPENPYVSSGRKPRLLIVGAGMMGRETFARVSINQLGNRAGHC